MELKDKTEEFETCVCGCGELTDVKKDTLVINRPHYVLGAGQLKPSCYERIYGFDKRKRKEKLEVKLWLQDGN